MRDGRGNFIVHSEPLFIPIPPKNGVAKRACCKPYHLLHQSLKAGTIGVISVAMGTKEHLSFVNVIMMSFFFLTGSQAQILYIDLFPINSWRDAISVN